MKEEECPNGHNEDAKRKLGPSLILHVGHARSLTEVTPSTGEMNACTNVTMAH